MPYQFIGVPRVFQTRAQALSFLTNSPGYVRRRRKYLETYWPGLIADVGGYGATQEKALRARSAKLRGVKTPGLDTVVASAGKAAGKWAKGQTRDVLGAALSGNADTNRAIKAPPVVQRTARAAETVMPSPRTIETVGDLTVGKGLTNLAQGQGPKNWQDVAGLGVDLATVLPVGRAAKGGFLTARGVGRAGSRVLKAGELTQQLPRSRSRLAQTLIEDLADKGSVWLSGESRAAGAGRSVLRTATVEARVAKAAGRAQLRDAGRVRAALEPYIRALPKQGSREDVAHFWWAQLPRSHRNVEGLRAVRERQTQELADLTSGKVLARLNSQAAAVKAQIGEAQRAGEHPAGLLADLDDINMQIADLPAQIEDLSTAVARLDDVIAHPPKVSESVIDAVHALSGDRQAVLESAGKLKPERAEARKGIVSDWAGIEPTGEEAYVGHRLGKVKGARSSLLPARVATGRPGLPQGVAKQNLLRLASTGRLRESTHVALDDWQAAQTYRSALQSRADIGKMGRPLVGADGVPRIGADDVLVNPKSRLIPPQWRADKLAQIADAGYHEADVRAAAKEITDSYLADNPDSIRAMIDAATAQGQRMSDLRVVKRKTAERYFTQFTAPAPSGAAGKVYDAAVDLTVASIVFGRIGYVPKNIAQNLIMATPHQGVYLFANLPRALQVIADPEMRHLLSAEVGFSGATVGLEKSAAALAKGITHKTASAVGAVADTPLRLSAFLHEAAAEGVIPKLNPVLRPQDRQALKALLTNPANRALLDDIASRSVEAMADFSRLTPAQRKMARRWLIIPGWLWAGSRYPFHFAATHPGRSAAIAYVAAGEPGAPEELQVNKPINEYMAQGVPDWAQGLNVGGKVFRTGSLSPVGTPWELAHAVAQQDGKTVGDYTNPVAAAAWNVAHSTADSPNGPYKTDTLSSFEAAGRRLVPNIGLVEDLISPPENDRYYPEDRSRAGRLKREVGVLPIEVKKKGTPSVSAYRKVFADREEMRKQLVALDGGKGGTRLSKPLREAFNMKARVEAARAQARRAHPEGGVEYKRDTLQREMRVYAASVGKKPSAAMLAASKTMSEDELDDALRRLRGLYSYYDTIGKARDYIKSRT